MQGMMRALVVAAVLATTTMLGACGAKAPRAGVMPIEVVLAKDVVDGGRSAQVDLVGVGAGEQAKFASKSVREWFRGGDPDRLAGANDKYAKMLQLSDRAPSASIPETDAFWVKSMERSAITLFVFAQVTGEDTTGKDVAWRKELPMDPARYEGERIRLEVQRGGVNVLNLKPEAKK
ncbi:MAG: hypothetical protein K2X32_01570 [Phycisphaerales bacterium]|nr:hypothetical protein [Phycisphaerales bacterium]